MWEFTGFAHLKRGVGVMKLRSSKDILDNRRLLEIQDTTDLKLIRDCISMPAPSEQEDTKAFKVLNSLSGSWN